LVVEKLWTEVATVTSADWDRRLLSSSK